MNGGPHLRVSSPWPGRSILMTSAPRSPSICVAVGPARMRVRSKTRMPDNGPDMSCPLRVCGKVPALSAGGGARSRGVAGDCHRSDHLMIYNTSALMEGHSGHRIFRETSRTGEEILCPLAHGPIGLLESP